MIDTNLTKKGIFLTFEGISDTIFDSQVALHVKEMKEKGIELDIIVFETWPRMYKKSAQRLNKARLLAQTKVCLYRGAFIYFPFSEIINALLLFFVIFRLKNRPQFIHARSDYAASTCFLVSKILKIPIIWDCRGDTEAEFKSAFKANNILKHTFKYFTLVMIRYHTFVSAKICSRAIFVTDLLRQRKGNLLKNKETFIIPTCASSTIFYFSKKIRHTKREELGFRDRQRVLIYSGGMVSYQNFPEYVKIFNSLYVLDSNWHFLIVTPDTKRANIILAELSAESYTLMSASFKEMNSLYNAADLGILIRDANEVNDVASPTKFSEYCLAGLPIIMNDSVKQSYKYALKFGNLISYDQCFGNSKLIKFDFDFRKQISLKATKVLSRESNINKYLKLFNF